MKTLALLVVLGCSSVAWLDNSAVAATPRFSFQAKSKQFQTAPSGLSNPIAKVGLNPQPLPPRWNPPTRRINPGAKVGLNPQPLPPRVFKKF